MREQFTRQPADDGVNLVPLGWRAHPQLMRLIEKIRKANRARMGIYALLFMSGTALVRPLCRGGQYFFLAGSITAACAELGNRA
jgi:hypothetical protein